MRRALAILLVLAGCQKEGAGGGASSAWDFPAETTALIGFVRRGPAPSADELKAAVIALLGETNPEITMAIEGCVAPVSAHLERTTLAVLGAPKDERVVVRASGPGLRGALETCLGTMLEKQGKKLEPRDEGKHTLYSLGGGDPIAFAWSGTDSVVVAAKPETIDATLAAAGGLRGSPIEKALSETDTSSAIWIAAAGPNLPAEAEIERIAGSIKDLTGAVNVTFKSPESAARGASEIQEMIPKGVKVSGNQMTVGINVADFPSMFAPSKKQEVGKTLPPLSAEQARAIVAAGPLIFGLFLFAGGNDQPVEAPPPPPPSEPVLPEPVPVEPPAPAPPP
jgi:hypothetical protein